MKKRIFKAADLFCGAGGTSTGLFQACADADLELELLAINHWQIAIDTHSVNHPYANHLCESADNVDPRKVVPSGRLNLLVASPECTHHSNARGGRPMSDQSRASAWHVLRWAEALYIENILIENVKEFRSWGPLGASGRPIRKLRGQLYVQFLSSLRSLGYYVEDRVLNAANYGDPTTRERLFIIARRKKRISWPEPTHSSKPSDDLFDGRLQPWCAAREVIDWNLSGKSIFARKRPLAAKTLQRIAAGLKKFGGVNAEPFLVVLRNHGSAKSVDGPVPTVTANGNHVGLCEPFVIPQQSKGSPRHIDKPLPTIATKGTIALVEPFMLNIDHHGGNGQQIRSVDSPLPTQTTKARTALVEPFLISVNHGDSGSATPARRSHSLDEPMPTVTTSRGHALVEPFIFAHQRRENQPTSVDEPIQTITAQSSDFALIEPFITPQSNDGAPRSVNDPLNTITTTSRGIGLVEPFLVKYNGTADANSIDDPVDTVTAKDRFALVTPDGSKFYVDIRFRMLQPRELARAMSFGDGYIFRGNREDMVKQVGNAVPVKLAKALCSAVLG